MNKVTYNQLTKTLATLGFEKVERSNFTAFRNDKYDAMIVLPKGTNTTVVSPAHLLTVERTVTGKGILPPDKFSRMIIGVRRPRVPRIVRSYSTVGSVVTQVEAKAIGRPHTKPRQGIATVAGIPYLGEPTIRPHTKLRQGIATVKPAAKTK